MVITRKRCENTEDRVDLGTIELLIDQGSNWPIKRCELTKIELTKDRVDHKPDHITIFWSFDNNFEDIIKSFLHLFAVQS